LRSFWEWPSRRGSSRSRTWAAEEASGEVPDLVVEVGLVVVAALVEVVALAVGLVEGSAMVEVLAVGLEAAKD
jgi:hypothetical protein